MGPLQISLGELAERLGGRSVEGDAAFVVSGVASLGEAGPSDLGFLRSARHEGELAKSRVGAVIAPKGVDVCGRPAIRSDAPNLDIARAAAILRPAWRAAPGVHRTAVVEEGADVDASASIGPYAVVGARTRVGAGSVLHAHVTLYPDVVVGSDCELHAGVVVREGTVLGDRVRLHAGVVLGADGFGYEFDERGGLEKVPQLGTVRVEDDVEIGALSAVDRARFGTTRVGRGAKIDNLVQVGHNCDVGEGSVIVAQSGLAGGSVLGRRVFLMAQSGVGNRARIGDGSFLGARAGVIEDLEPGSRVWGFPALPERAWHRAMTGFSRLPEILRRLRALERRTGPRGPGGGAS